MPSSSDSAGDFKDKSYSDDEPEPSGSSSVPPATKGWRPTPSHWDVRPVNGSWVEYGPPPEDTLSTSGDPVPVPYHEVEIYTHIQDSRTTHYFRPPHPLQRHHHVLQAEVTRETGLAAAEKTCSKESVLVVGRLNLFSIFVLQVFAFY